MSGREWKPGDVIAWINAAGYAVVGMVDRRGRVNAVDAIGCTYTGRSTTPEGRPLVVIDPEDAEQVERLARARQQAWDGPEPHTQVSAMQAALREFADPKTPCGASLTLGKDAALYRCSEPEGHDGPHVDGTCRWSVS